MTFAFEPNARSEGFLREAERFPEADDVHNACSVKPNKRSRALVRLYGDAAAGGVRQYRRMGRSKAKTPAQMSHHWYLNEWAQQAGKRQADAIRDLGWSRAKASALFTGEQGYMQEHIEEVAKWLSLRPFELLMPPDLAAHYRGMDMAAKGLVAVDADPLGLAEVAQDQAGSGKKRANAA